MQSQKYIKNLSPNLFRNKFRCDSFASTSWPCCRFVLGMVSWRAFSNRSRIAKLCRQLGTIGMSTRITIQRHSFQPTHLVQLRRTSVRYYLIIQKHAMRQVNTKEFLGLSTWTLCSPDPEGFVLVSLHLLWSTVGSRFALRQVYSIHNSGRHAGVLINADMFRYSLNCANGDLWKEQDIQKLTRQSPHKD